MSFAPGTITNVKDPISSTEFGVIELKVLENLKHTSLGIWMSATPSNPSAISEGGTAIFRRQKLQQVHEYTKANMYDNGNIAESEIAAKISVDQYLRVKYEIESMTRDGTLYATRAAYLGYIASSVAKSITGYMDAMWIEEAVKTAKDKYDKTTNPFPYVINANWGDLNTEDLRKSAFRQVARARIDISRNLDQYNMGVEINDFGAFLHDYITTDLLLEIAQKGGGNSATAISRQLINGSRIVAGLGEVKDHIFFNKQITAGKSFAADKAFDFRHVWGVIAHREALFVALYGMNTVSRINQAGNQEIITKFGVYHGAVRPDLIKILVDKELTAPTPVKRSKKKKVVNLEVKPSK